MKKIVGIFLTFITILTLVSCNEKEDLRIYEGYVVDKIFDEGYVYTTTVIVNKSPIIQTHYVPDRWYVIIYKDEKITKHQISEEYYSTLTVGSYISLNKEVNEDECKSKD